MGFGFLYARIWWQRNKDKSWSNSTNQRIMTFLEVAVLFVILETQAFVLFLMPWVKGFFNKKDSRILRKLMWWFENWTYVGHGLRDTLLSTLKYITFWVLVLATKFGFSYFFLIRPMISGSKSLITRLDINYKTYIVINLSSIPVILAYLTDLQFWFSICCSFAGAIVGVLAHLGEIQNMRQLKLNFQFFAYAVLSNLTPKEQLLSWGGEVMSSQEAKRSWLLRWGLVRSDQKRLHSELQWARFALIWNEIIMILREEDIISDKEVEILYFPQNAWNISDSISLHPTL